MDMEEKHNPNSHKLPKRDAPDSWSDLPQDLLNSVFDRLGFADFQLAKSVCSSWYSASSQSVPKNQIPWLILFPEDDDNSCTLFNPEEKGRLYKRVDLGLEFAESVCVATYGSWLLMRDRRCNLYILNLFTNERINLPPVESHLGKLKVKRTSDDQFLIANKVQWKGTKIKSPVFWIDEETKYYVVLWKLGEWCVVYVKKGYNLWLQIPETSDCLDMVYKDHKLYLSSRGNSLRIFDFSGEISQQTFEGLCPRSFVDTKLVVTVTGDVLGVVRRSQGRFGIYKVYSSGGFSTYEKVKSLGDEAMLLDQGITLLANDIEGFKRNCIYFNIGSHEQNTTEVCIFTIETQKMEPLHKFDSSSVQLSNARWFLPSFKRK